MINHIDGRSDEEAYKNKQNRAGVTPVVYSNETNKIKRKLIAQVVGRLRYTDDSDPLYKLFKKNMYERFDGEYRMKNVGECLKALHISGYKSAYIALALRSLPKGLIPQKYLADNAKFYGHTANTISIDKPVFAAIAFYITRFKPDEMCREATYFSDKEIRIITDCSKNFSLQKSVKLQIEP